MRILLASDFSRDAQVAYRFVRRLALPSGSRVRIVHAIEPVTTVELFAPAALLALSEASEAEARSNARALADELERSGVTAQSVLGFGRAADVVLDECAAFAPDLVVVGSRGRGALATTVLGSVSAELVDRAPCPVFVARKAGLDTIVLAEDGTTASAAGARAIAGLRPFAAAAVRVVSVVDATLPVMFADPMGTAMNAAAYRAWEESLPAIRDAHLGYARDRARALEAEGVRATFECREGNVAAEIVAAAVERGADCVVVGTRGGAPPPRARKRGPRRAARCAVLGAHRASDAGREGDAGRRAGTRRHASVGARAAHGGRRPGRRLE